MENPKQHWFYKRFKVNNPVERWTFQIAGGLAFLLRRFHVIQPEYIEIAPNQFIKFPVVSVELTDGTGATRWQLQAIPAQLYSAPRLDNVIIKTETTPFDQLGYGVNMSAVFKPRSTTINLFYDKGENIFVRLSGMEKLTPPGYLCPDYIDLAIEGYFIP
jgi:hypothetical protein